jgi:hypothetical protein
MVLVSDIERPWQHNLVSDELRNALSQRAVWSNRRLLDVPCTMRFAKSRPGQLNHKLS